MCTKTRAVLGIYVGLCFGHSVTSQAARMDPTLKVTAEERYGDGIILGATENEALGQFMSRLSFQPGVSSRNDRGSASGWYSADLLLRHGSGNMTVDHRGHGQWEHQLSRRLGVSASASVWRVTDPTSLPRLGLARELSPIFYSRIDSRALAALFRTFSLRGSYRFEYARILDGKALPGAYHSPAASLLWATHSRWVLGLEYRLQVFLQESQQSLGNSLASSLRFQISRTSYAEIVLGAVYFDSIRGTAAEGWLPRVTADFIQDWRWGSIEMNIGQDLVGASGFAAALWAQYASSIVHWNVSGNVRTFLAMSFYRNGIAPAVDLFSRGADNSEGYRIGLGIEWRLSTQLSFNASVDRFQQTGAGAEVANVAWNLAGIRLIYSPTFRH